MKKYNQSILILLFISSWMSIIAQPNVSKSNNMFAFDLLHLAESGDNICISPFSISSAMAMTYAGSANKTKNQIAQVFYFKELPSLHMEFGSLNLSLQDKASDHTKLNIANSIWIQQDLQLKQEFLDVLNKDYLSSANLVDYKLESELSREKINNWVSDKTEAKITNLLQPGVINQLTRLVLVNAIYFKSPWKKQFKIEKTYPDKFNISKNKQAEVNYMKENISLNYLDAKYFQAIELPYENDKLSMVIVLPKNSKSLNKLTKQMNSEWFDELLQQFNKEYVEVNVPKFNFRYNISLKDNLAKLGMPIAFKNEADFSEITGDLSLKIDDVIHEAYIDVNEEGTEAAAATAVVMRVKSVFRSDEPIKFKADKPFYFFIKENEKNTLLFIGKIVNPKN